MIKRLEKASSAKVEMRGFHSTYFPHPGCVAEEVVFLPAAASSGAAHSTAPIITIRKLTIESTLFGLLSKPHRIKRIIADGLRVHAPADLHPAPDSQNDPLVIEELAAADALLEVGKSGNKPLVFQVHHVVFHDIGGQNRIPFQVSLQMPLPPGEVESSGWLGPWKDEKGTVRSTAISGTYVLRGANLAIFKSIAGEISSRGEFAGTLERINIAGNTDDPQFEVKKSGHRFHLATQFRGTVDLKTGDVVLPMLQAKLGSTNLTANASISGSPSGGPKTVALNVTEGKGQIQDLILLFSSAPQSPVTGPVVFHARTLLPPQQRPFKERVQLTGDFSIDPAKFTSSDSQKNIDQLSERAEGKKDKDKDFDQNDDAGGFERVLTKLTGRVRLAGGLATLSEISFSVPGARGDMNGTYSLLNERVNFHGKMLMQATVSQATTGKKSFFLKVLDPFFKKKHAGAEVPITMTGLYGQTHFAAGLK